MDQQQKADSGLPQGSEEFKSFASNNSPPNSPQQQIEDQRLSRPLEQNLLQIYTHNLQRKREFKGLIEKLLPNLLLKKLAKQLQGDSRAMGVRQILDSDDQEEDELKLGLRQIKKDFNEKKDTLNDLEKNKYATLQKAFIRGICQDELYRNQKLMSLIKNRYQVKGYFGLPSINKFGVLTVTDPNVHTIKFVSVGIPNKVLDSIEFNFQISSVATGGNNLLLIGNNNASVYSLDQGKTLFKTHDHQSKLAYGAFTTVDNPVVVTVAEGGIARMFDVDSKSLFWMCMTDTNASIYLCKGERLYYAVGSELLYISLRTKQVVNVGKYAEPIKELDAKYVKAGKTYFNANGNDFQVSSGSQCIRLPNNIEYYSATEGCSHLMIGGQKRDLLLTDPCYIETFNVQEGTDTSQVAVFAGTDGEIDQIWPVKSA